MLEQLTIRDFAIIDRLQLDWRPGFTVITGETGAGKSIIIDAIGALLGDRLGPEVVRTGAARAVVQGVFSVGMPAAADLASVLDEYGLEPEDGALIVSREIAAAGGRGGARVNGRVVPVSVLQELAEQLVDVHGQSQHMALLRTREQMEYLDRFGSLVSQRSAVGGLVRELRSIRAERDSLRHNERQAAREQEVLSHQVQEIESAALSVDEEAELLAIRSRQEHAERLRLAISAAQEALTGREAGETERPGAVDLLSEAVASVSDAARFDAELEAEVEQLNAALAQADESARSLRSYVDAIDADPEALQRTEERLVAIADLKRKYGATVADVLAFMVEASERLERYENREAHLLELDQREQRAAARLGEAAGQLSAARSAAGKQFAEAVQRELGDLNMRGTRFEVHIEQEDETEGVPVAQRRLAFDATGVDRVEFLVAANAGAELRPIQRVASGGELARLALALKTILARDDSRATLIFDEVDQGVGGRTAPVVGEKLWSIAATGHQVFCVTHMPQVAAFADQHYVVAKAEEDGRTSTRVVDLDGEGPVDELAAMLAGSPTPTARENARELLQRARDVKSRRAVP